MINLISPEQKRDIRAARTNVTLLHYCTMFLVAGVLILLIYGAGFWLVFSDKRAATAKHQELERSVQAYAGIKQEADSFRKNLAIAKKILANETSYSTFLTTLGGDLPSGAILTALSVGTAAKTPATANNLTIEARTTSYNKTLELKEKLEKSSLFEDVSLVNATRPDDLSKLEGLDARYPYQAIYSVKLSKGATQNPGVTQ